MSSDHKSPSRLAALQWPIILTIGVILFLCVVSGVFYLYVLDRERYYNERYFRLLHAEAEGVSLKLENYREVIFSAGNLAANGWMSREVKDGNRYKYALPDIYLSNHEDIGENLNSFRSTKCTKTSHGNTIAQEIAMQLCQVMDFYNVSVSPLPLQNPFQKSESQAEPQKCETVLEKVRAMEAVINGRGRPFWVDVERRSSDSIFMMQAIVPSLRIEGIRCQYVQWLILAEVDGKNLFGKILLEQSFDDLLLADKKGNVLFQSGDSGLQFAQADRLIAGGKNASERGTSTLKFVSANGKDIGEVEPQITIGRKEGSNLLKKVPVREEVAVGDRNLLVFALPVNLPIVESEQLSGEKEQEKRPEASLLVEADYVLVGVIGKDRFRNETWQLSPSILLMLLLIALLTLLSLPLLKLLLMTPQDQWTIRDFALVVGASIIGTGLLTLSLVDSGVFWWKKSLVDDELKEFAASIHKHVNTEIDGALKVLKDFDGIRAQQIEKDVKVIGEEEDETPCYKKKRSFPPPVARINILKSEAPDPYRFFDSVFWINCGGKLVEHWDTRTKANYFLPVVTNLSDRAYFIDIVEKRSWQRSKETVKNKEESKTPFILEPVFSRLDGSNTAVLAIQSKVIGSGLHDITVAGLESRFLSLFEPIIPPGTGFAVVDMNGRVLFHSQGQRNLREHFFEEIDDNKKLKALINARAQDCENGTYGGNAHRFCVSEFKDIPWSLVVFKNMEPLRTANLQAVTVACFLFAIYTLVLLIVMIAGLVVARMRRQTVPTMLWPSKKQHDSYVGGASVALLLFFSGLITLWLFPPHYAFVLGVIILPLWGIIAAVVFFRVPTTVEFLPKFLKQSNKGDYRQAYLALCGSLLALCSVLPATICMMLSYEAEQILILKAGALDIAKSFARSADQIREKYQYHKDDRLIAQRLADFGRLDVHLGETERNVDSNDWWSIVSQTPVVEDFMRMTTLRVQWKVNASRGESVSEQSSRSENWFEEIYRSWRVPYNDEFTKTHGLFREAQQSEDIRWPTDTTVSYRPVQALTRLDNDQHKTTERWNVAVIVHLWLMRLPAVVLLALVLGVAYSAYRKPVTIPEFALSKTVIVPIGIVVVMLLLLWPGETLWFVWILFSVLFLVWWLIHVLPGFVARRVFLLDLVWDKPNHDAFAARLQMASSPARTEFSKQEQQVFEKEFKASERLAEIGAGVLKDQKKRAEFLWAARSEGFEPDPVWLFPLEEAMHHYESVWVEMNKEEKMALFHLARNGFIVGTHPSLLSLVKKGWATRSPELQFVNNSFRQFVLLKKDEILTLQQEFDKGIWDQLVWPIGVGMVFILAGLMYTQQELLASATAFVGILGGLVPVISKLFDLFKTQKPSLPAS
ncbi:MAG: hypothetical protein A4E19_08215 [Nitrospira sp. SG-bin1]|nr:MAG: hypothetical protein A4E19_08215 [Nitrospira sp. SG-bin1]